MGFEHLSKCTGKRQLARISIPESILSIWDRLLLGCRYGATSRARALDAAKRAAA